MKSTIVVLVLVAMATIVNSAMFEKDGQPAFSCPDDEEYYTCSQIHCYKTCEHLITPPACPSVSPDCYKPACECKEDNLRNEKGVCVPPHQCKKPTN